MAVGGAFKRLRPAIAEINTAISSEFCVAPLAPPPPAAGAFYPRLSSCAALSARFAQQELRIKTATGDLTEAKQIAKLSSSSGKSHYIVNG